MLHTIKKWISTELKRYGVVNKNLILIIWWESSLLELCIGSCTVLMVEEKRLWIDIMIHSCHATSDCYPRQAQITNCESEFWQLPEALISPSKPASCAPDYINEPCIPGHKVSKHNFIFSCLLQFQINF